MPDRAFANGTVCFALGLLFSGIGSLLDRFVRAGSAVNFAHGALDGLSVVAFGAAVFIFASAMRRGQESG